MPSLHPARRAQLVVVLLAALAWIGHEAGGHEVLMTLAMMLPTTLPAVGYVGLNSLAWRRRRAVALFTAAYAAVWALFTATGAAATAPLHPTAVVAFSLVVAAACEAVPWARSLHAAARRPPALPPAGWRADWASTAFGLRQAALSVASCGALMLAVVAPVAAPTHLALAPAATAFVWWRALGGRHAHPRRPVPTA